MPYPRGFAVALALVAGCASAGSASEQPDAGGGGGPDAARQPDAGVGVDASVDASTVTPVDAPPGTDAPPGCTPMTTQLLVNPAFDGTPLGTGWTEVPIDAAAPLITGDSSLIQSSPNVAWLGGFESSSSTTKVTDRLSQQVTIPAGTTQLVLTGHFQVKTSEWLANWDDTAAIELQGQTALSLHEGSATTAWKAFSYTFTPTHAGQTVTLRLSSSNDDTYVTSFFFDSLALTATYCP